MKLRMGALCSISALLVGCAGSGGTINTPSTTAVPAAAPPPTTPTPPATTAPVDTRIKFDTFSRSEKLPSGDTTITYKVGEFKPTDSFPKTDKYKIVDYGLLEVTVKGLNPGCPRSECNEEYAPPGPWNHRPASILESDINGDGHKDFYVFEQIHGSRDQAPNDLVFAFINDGKGHFKLSNSTVFATGSACIHQGGEGPQSLAAKDRKSDCGYTTGPLRHALVADFNGDGMDDIFGSMALHLSDKGVLHNKTLTSIPDYFRSNHISALFTHDQYAGDATGDKKLDIFMPTWHQAEKGYWGDGTKIDGCSNCVATLPWSLLVNDGTGKFTLNQNFPILGVGKDHPLLKGTMPHNGDPAKGVLWGGQVEMLRATTAAIGDFNKDGFGDIAIGWMNPRATETWGLGKNSAGAVYYNDGKNDWRNKPIVPLPASWYGANGNSNDMEVMDFDGDGWPDIVLASTKHKPYYEGRVVQFFKNNKDGTFIDVTTQVHPGIGKYENGTGTPLWNGEGQLRMLDFDHDGDLDIVDTVHHTYVLINDGKGKFTVYDHTKFPNMHGERLLFPVEIDNKYQYDFISYSTTCATDECTTSYFQVLDPPMNSGPSLYELMLDDFLRKPSNYTTAAAIANRGYTDLFYYSRWNSNNARVFSTYNNGVQTFGGTFAGNGIGLTVLNAKSAYAKNGNVFGGDTDAVGIYANRGKLFAMTAFSHTKLNTSISSEFFGTAQANTTANTFGVELSYKDRTGPFSYSIGSRYNSTVMKGFVEQGADVNLRIADQHYNTANLVTTLDYTNSFNYKGIKFFYGADWEYLRYFYSNGDSVRASTGGSFTTVNGVNHLKREGSTLSLNAGAWFNPNTNMLFSVSNATKDPSFTVAFGYRF
jgi:hypothetical protein